MSPNLAFSLLLAASLALPALPAAGKPEKPQIDINFDDDASSLVISATWNEGGKLKRETFSFGTDMYLSFEQQGKDWKQGPDFHSRSWEAYLNPDGSGFLLMERHYNGKAFQNLSLSYYQYAPLHRTMTLSAANGSPWWSPDGAKLALVEVSAQKNYHCSLYDLANDGQQIRTEPG